MPQTLSSHASYHLHALRTVSAQSIHVRRLERNELTVDAPLRPHQEDEDGRKPAGSTRLRHEFLPGMVNKHANQETIRMRLRQRSLTRQTCRAGSVA